MKNFRYFFLIGFIIFSILYVRFLKGENKIDKDQKLNYIGVRYEVEKGNTFIGILRRSHIEENVIDSIILYFSKHYEPEKIDIGDEIFIFTDEKFNFKRLEYKKDLKRTYVVEYLTKFLSYVKDDQQSLSVVLIEGVVEDNLVNSLKSKGENEALALKFSNIFDWRIDLTSEVKKHDRYTILIEKKYINGKFYQYGDIIYASYENDKNLFEAFLYNDGKQISYFDQNGISMEGNMLKAPLETYSRISSYFTSKRYHPILKKYLPHYAVDYVAPRKTPIFAASDGYIIYLGYNYIGGNTIRIDHENGYSTEYCHLHSYKKGLKIGKFVKKGEIIGYVGKSGYATGYHLHFAVKKNGKFINPLKIKNEKETKIDENKREEFYRYVDNIRTLVLAIKSYKSFPIHFSKSDFLFKYANTIVKSPNI